MNSATDNRYPTFDVLHIEPLLGDDSRRDSQLKGEAAMPSAQRPSIAVRVGQIALGQHDDPTVPHALYGSIVIYAVIFFVVGIPLDFIVTEWISDTITVAHIVAGWLLLWRKVPHAYGPPFKRGVGIMLTGSGIILIYFKEFGPPLALLGAGLMCVVVGMSLTLDTLGDHVAE